MSENELNGLFSSLEIDPDYVPQTAGYDDEARLEPEPKRITTKKAWFMSLFMPVLMILAFAFFVLVGLAQKAPGVILFVSPCPICGAVSGALIIRDKIDLSRYFPVKLILFAVLASGVTLTLTVFVWVGAAAFAFLLWGIPIFAAAAELIYAYTRKADGKTRLCLALSSFVYGWLGIAAGAAAI